MHLSLQGAPIVRINGRLQALDGTQGFDVAGLLSGQEHLELVAAGGSVDRASNATSPISFAPTGSGARPQWRPPTILARSASICVQPGEEEPTANAGLSG